MPLDPFYYLFFVLAIGRTSTSSNANRAAHEVVPLSSGFKVKFLIADAALNRRFC